MVIFRSGGRKHSRMGPVDVKQPTTTTTTTNKCGMHRVIPNFKIDVKMTSVMRKLEVLGDE